MTSGEIADEPDSGYARLEQQIAWYDRKSRDAQWWYKNVKYVEFAVGALIPAAALINTYATVVLGVAAILFEGLQQINQWQHNWITYRSTCEALRHEKYSFLGRSGSYNRLSETNARKLLVERVEGLISTEHSKWISRQEFAKQALGKLKVSRKSTND